MSGPDRLCVNLATEDCAIDREDIRDLMEQENYNSVSEFIRDLIREELSED